MLVENYVFSLYYCQHKLVNQCSPARHRFKNCFIRIIKEANFSMSDEAYGRILIEYIQPLVALKCIMSKMIQLRMWNIALGAFALFSFSSQAMALLQWHTLTKPDGSALVHSANPTIRLHGNPYYRSEVGFSEFTANCSISDVPLVKMEFSHWNVAAWLLESIWRPSLSTPPINSCRLLAPLCFIKKTHTHMFLRPRVNHWHYCSGHVCY